MTAINLQVDVNGVDPAGFTTLVFEPVYNTDQGTAVNGEWQDWDAYNAGQAVWWSSNPIPGAPNRDTFVTWATIVAANPNAVIVGGFGVNQGNGNPTLVTAVDTLTIGAEGVTTVYNFEPYRVATTKVNCKNGRWQTLRRANDSAFENQGDCVSYAETGK